MLLRCYASLRISTFVDGPMHIGSNAKWCFPHRGKGREGAKSEMSKLGKFGRKRVECSWLNQVGGRKKGRGEDRVSEARIEVGCYGERVEGRMKGRRARD